MTPLHVAIQTHGRSVNEQSQIGNSLETVELLFQHGASAQDKVNYGISFLLKVCKATMVLTNKYRVHRMAILL
jgi:hypothetical protein